jgi:hypothetical protein
MSSGVSVRSRVAFDSSSVFYQVFPSVKDYHSLLCTSKGRWLVGRFNENQL